MAAGIDGASVAIDGVVYRYIAFDEIPELELELELEPLTATERDVVTKVVAGWSTGRIAESRGTSARTVANQLQAVYRKLGVRSRHELIARVVAGDRST